MIITQKPYTQGASTMQSRRVQRSSNVTMGSFLGGLEKRLNNAIQGAEQGSKEFEELFFKASMGVKPDQLPNPVRNYANGVLGNKYKTAGAIGGAIRGFFGNGAK